MEDGQWEIAHNTCKDSRDQLESIRLRNNWLLETFTDIQSQTQIKMVKH